MCNKKCNEISKEYIHKMEIIKHNKEIKLEKSIWKEYDEKIRIHDKCMLVLISMKKNYNRFKERFPTDANHHCPDLIKVIDLIEKILENNIKESNELCAKLPSRISYEKWKKEKKKK